MRSDRISQAFAVLSLVTAGALGWADATLVPMKCRGGYSVEQLQHFLPKARVTLWLPSTRAVALDQEQRCLLVTVDDVGGWRLAELVLRGVSVPHRAVQVQLMPAHM
jgi:hypothetical protein